MIVIGLTGLSGSGKGYVCSLFGEYGIPSIDTDNIVHNLYIENTECINRLVGRFGVRILSKDGTVNRKALGEIVFGDSYSLKDLNEIVHAFTLDMVDRLVSDYSDKDAKAVIVDAPQLFESGYNQKCNCIISVLSSHQKRIERICKRDNISAEKAELRIKNQHSDSFFTDNSDFVIFNNGEDVKIQVVKIIKELGIL